MTLEEVFGTVLDLLPSELGDDSAQGDIASWTSLAHITLITSLEETYGVTFTTEEIPKVQTLGAARRLLRAKGAPV